MTAAIALDHPRLARFCARFRARELAIFGSALRSDFRPDSDVDVLVTLLPGARWNLDDYLDAQDELSALFGRKVDLVLRHVLEQSENYIRREAILQSAERIYGT